MDNIPDCDCHNPTPYWTCFQESNSGVQNGRLNLHEVHSIFVLACECCGEELKKIRGDDLAGLMTVELQENKL